MTSWTFINYTWSKLDMTIGILASYSHFVISGKSGNQLSSFCRNLSFTVSCFIHICPPSEQYMHIKTLWLGCYLHWKNFHSFQNSRYLTYISSESHYILSLQRPSILFTLWNQIASLTRCSLLPYGKGVFHYILYWQKYPFSLLYPWVKRFVNTCRPCIVRSVAALGWDLNVIRKSGIWIDYGSHMSSSLYVSV